MQPDDEPVGGRLLQIHEHDLATLEHCLPELMMSTMAAMTPKDRVQWRKVMSVIHDVRWNYGPPTSVQVIPAGEPRSDWGNGGDEADLIDAVRSVLSQLPPQFTVRHVIAKLSESHPLQHPERRLASISSALRRLANTGSIELIQAGKGRRASVYALPPTPPVVTVTTRSDE
jgi:hypothetical protein